MKKIAFLSLITFTLFACKKNNSNDGMYKVKYTVSGSSVNQFKISFDSTNYNVVTPFATSKDSIAFKPAGTYLKLEVKADPNRSLVGSIYVNDVLVATQTDSDPDADSKTAVKIEYKIPR